MRSICKARVMLFVFVILLLVMSVGCGSRPDGATASFKKKSNISNGKSDEGSKPSDDARESADSVKEESPFVYLEKKEMEDINDPGAVYEIYMPRDAEVTDGFATLSQHGISYTADIYGYGEADQRYASFEDHLTLKQKYAHEADSDYIDVADTGIIENGADRYFIFTGRGVDYEGVSFELRQLYYLEMQPSGAGILWDITVYEDYADEDTDPLIDELAECHGINLDLIKPGSAWEVNADQDSYQAKEGDKALEDLEGYRYMGLTSISDYYRETYCDLMLPKARITDIDRTSAFSFLHGVLVSADVSEIYAGNALVTAMKSSADIKYETALHNPQTIRNVKRSAMLPVPGLENALQMAISYEKKSYQSEEYLPRVEALCYIPIDDTYYLSLEIFLSYEQRDDSTDRVIQELETAYGIDLFQYLGGQDEADVPEAEEGPNQSSDAYAAESEAPASKPEGAPKQDNAAGDVTPLTMAMLMGGDGETTDSPDLPDTVLWFNATYAPLTYSNGFNWRLVGGLQITEDNKELIDWGLQNSWNITDRTSALEAVERLKEKGHRQTCRECMEELNKMGLLDLEEKEFRKKFLQSNLSGDYRYVMAYNIHKAGHDADYLAAWDLCRVNQLYADFYILGYMTYEEAMDASLENSLVLQQLYSSWEEMVDGYMLGFQFWSKDSGSKEDSPTKERYRYYEMLKDSDDSPYELDWNMELTKSW